MSRALSIGEVKAFTRQLVSAAGGVDACGLELGISHQRVSQYQNPNHADVMPLMSILALEAVIGQPIVTGAAARAIEAEARESIHSAVVGAVTGSAKVLEAISGMDADQHRDAGEIRAVQAAAADNLLHAQRVADAAAGLVPTRRLRAVGD
jgi:hypothetical protein